MMLVTLRAPRPPRRKTSLGCVVHMTGLQAAVDGGSGYCIRDAVSTPGSSAAGFGRAYLRPFKDGISVLQDFCLLWQLGIATATENQQLPPESQDPGPTRDAFQ